MHTPQYLDTHAHLSRAFFPNIEEIIKKLAASDIKKVVSIATSIDEWEDVHKISELLPQKIVCAIGLHPELAYENDLATLQEDIGKLHDIAKTNNIVAIGECGLDYNFFEEKSDLEITRIKENQRILFEAQLDIAQELDLPVIIHCRKALEDLLPLLGKYKSINNHLRGVLHSVDGEVAIIEKIIALGFYVSFNGIMTFKNATHIQMLAKEIDISHIILETDSPFLAPVPMRGITNDPTNIQYIYEYLAKLKMLSSEEVIAIIDKNSHTLLSL